MLKQIGRKVFNSLGFEIRRKGPEPKRYEYFRNEQMIRGLAHCRDRGLNVNTIIDVGAAEGSWSLSASEIWPDADYVLFEPLEERKEQLLRLAAQKSNFRVVTEAAGKEKGQVKFHVAGDLDGSGMANESSEGPSIRSVNVTSVNDEVKRLQLKAPYLIKLDTHGFEVPIIEGCSEIMQDVSLFIIECYGFQIAKNSLLFWEMCQFLDQKGFRLIDIVDVVNRQKDNAFWQCDAFFVPADLELFKDISYI